MTDLIQQLYKMHDATPRAIEQIRALEKKAYAAFGKLNGWTQTGMTRNLLDELMPNYMITREIFDHIICYNQNRKPVAIVSQPYPNMTTVSDARSFADQAHLELHIPIVPEASIHYPNVTSFFVFTRPGTNVEWLPEQTMSLKQLGWGVHAI